MASQVSMIMSNGMNAYSSISSYSFSQSVKASLADSEPVASFLADLKMPMLALLLRRTRVASAEGGGKGCGADDAPTKS